MGHLDFSWGWQEKDIIQDDQKCNPMSTVAKVISMPQVKVCGQRCTRLRLPRLMPPNLQASLCWASWNYQPHGCPSLGTSILQEPHFHMRMEERLSWCILQSYEPFWGLAW